MSLQSQRRSPPRIVGRNADVRQKKERNGCLVLTTGFSAAKVANQMLQTSTSISIPSSRSIVQLGRVRLVVQPI
jgi:hypothetical protein